MRFSEFVEAEKIQDKGGGGSKGVEFPLFKWKKKSKKITIFSEFLNEKVINLKPI